ncbi:MAG: DUF2357 domain-containing protein [Candidatus Izimaplasma sp.]|nr:DUF2357 domain-containing protein [Candidatus Izimaplasma bacterium]
MKDGTAKRYYKKLNTTFTGVNKTDSFAKQFLNLFNSAESELYQKERLEKRIFDDSWIADIEAIVPVIDKITRNPRETLYKFQEVVPIERAKKTDPDTIKHLASNTQFIREVDRHGNVKPTKVLTSRHDSTINIYENRFLMTLVNKLYQFVELRYNLIIEKMHTEYVNLLKINSKLKWETTEINYDVKLRINRHIDDDEIATKNQELLDRLTEVRKGVANLKLSRFMKEMASYIPVRPPIMKTNIIMKNVDFKKCYDLWLKLDRVDQIGYEIDGFDRNLLNDKEIQEQLKNAMMVLYATVANSQADEFGTIDSNPFNYYREKKPKVLERIDEEKYLEPGSYEIEDNRLNQYFLDRIRSVNENEFVSLVEAEIPEDESIRMIYENLQEIADAAFVDFVSNKFVPENEKTIEDKIEMQKKIIGYYRDIEKAKRQNNRNFKKDKSLAKMKLDNFHEQLKAKKEAIQEAKKAEEERIRKEKMAALDAKAREKLIKQQKLAEAKKILTDAEKARKQKKAAKKRK